MPVELQTRAVLGEKGRLVIPVAMREALGLKIGDPVELRVEDSELRITALRERLRRAQDWVRQNVPPGVSLADELSTERREEAKYE